MMLFALLMYSWYQIFSLLHLLVFKIKIGIALGKTQVSTARVPRPILAEERFFGKVIITFQEFSVIRQ